MPRFALVVLFVGAMCSMSCVIAEERIPLRVVYVGEGKAFGNDRSLQFSRFLRRRFVKADIAERRSFDPTSAKDADVVLLDWSQSDSPLEKTSVPFGEVDRWHTPTVLLNHAGLLVAERWDVIGSAG
jgi:hypothetical protein